MQTWKEGSPGEAAGMVRFAWVGMFRALNSATEVEGDLDGAAALVAAEGECLEDVADPPRARHRPRPHPIHLLAGRTLQERVAGVAQQRLQTRPVVGVAALGQTEGGVVLLAQTDGALGG